MPNKVGVRYRGWRPYWEILDSPLLMSLFLTDFQERVSQWKNASVALCKSR